jgi:Flp pilus assembly protein TadG
MRPLRPLRRSLRKRLGQRGAVAVEFAFSLFFLIPLLLGMLDYGYYFWIGVNAVQAANKGLYAATHAPSPTLVPGCSGTAPGILAVTAASGFATAAVAAQMTQGLPAGFAAYTSTPVNDCITVSGSPAWNIQVQVDFPPVVGFLNPWMPASATPGLVRFRSGVLVGN